VQRGKSLRRYLIIVAGGPNPNIACEGSLNGDKGVAQTIAVVVD
jgi:hypothetical protein